MLGALKPKGPKGPRWQGSCSAVLGSSWKDTAGLCTNIIFDFAALTYVWILLLPCGIKRRMPRWPARRSSLCMEEVLVLIMVPLS